MKIVSHNLGNCRYPGFSEFTSENCLQNSSYIWSFPKENRFIHGRKLLSQAIYNLPSMKMTRSTAFGYGNRKVFRTDSNFFDPSPDTYHLKTDVDLNIAHRKGPRLAMKLEECSGKERKKFPGPGTYRIGRDNLQNDIPITIKSRRFFFYDDDLKKTKHCVSMQRYHPNTKLEENLRFRTITFGIGGRTPNENVSLLRNPGPGAYNVPGCFDRGYKGKLALN